MIYLFHGEDTYRSLKKLNETIEYFKKEKNAGASFFNVDEDNFDPAYFENLIKSSHLFGSKNMVILKRVIQNKEAENFILKNTESLRKSENIFIFYEEVLNESAFEIFKKNAEKIWEFKFLDKTRLSGWLDNELALCNLTVNRETKENLLAEFGANLWSLSGALEKIILFGGESENFEFKNSGRQFSDVAHPNNDFAVVDAFSGRLGRQAWLLFRKYLLSGADGEEIFWKICWQVKNLLLVKSFLEELNSKNKVSANSAYAEFSLKRKIKMHPFVLKKCLKAEKLFSHKELENFSEKLINIYQKSRYENLDLSFGLEKFLLEI